MSNTNDNNTNDTNANKDNGEKGFFAKHGWKLAAGIAVAGAAAGGAYYYMKNGGGAAADAGDVASGIAKLFK